MFSSPSAVSMIITFSTTSLQSTREQVIVCVASVAPQSITAMDFFFMVWMNRSDCLAIAAISVLVLNRCA